MVLYIKIFTLSCLLSLGLFGTLGSAFDKVFILQTHFRLLIPILIISVVFSIVYYLLFFFLNKVTSTTLVKWLLPFFVITGYPLSLTVGELLAGVSNNFFDTMNCRGNGCVSLVMTLYGELFFIFIPLFLITIFTIFRFQIKKQNSVQEPNL